MTYDTLVDMASPNFQYVYGDGETYLDHNSTSNNTSEPQSPMSSPIGYDMSYMHDFSAEVYPSPEFDAGEMPELQAVSVAAAAAAAAAAGGSTTAVAPPAKAPAKRKRENRYKNAPPSVLSRRRAQNRASQRAYRERKDQRIKDLEHMLDQAKLRNETLSQAYADLHAEYIKLKTAQLQEAAVVAAAATAGGYAFDAAVATSSSSSSSSSLGPNDRLSDLDLYSYPELTGYPL